MCEVSRILGFEAKTGLKQPRETPRERYKLKIKVHKKRDILHCIQYKHIIIK